MEVLLGRGSGSLIGAVAPDVARAVIEKYFGSWTATGAAPVTQLPPVPASRASVIAVPDASRVQDQVTLAQTIGVTRSNPDYYALRLGNNVLGGDFYSTRLSRDLRKNAGLVYSVDSSFEVGNARALYVVEYACDPGNVSRVHASIVRELRRMQQAPVTADELLHAKATLLRQMPLAEASTDSIAQALIARWDLHLPLDEPTRAAQRYIDLTQDQVQAAFARWLRPADLTRVTLGPAPK